MLSRLSVKKPYLVVVFLIIILILGIVAYLNIGVDFLPNMDFPYIMVVTVCPGLTPGETETQLTIPVESKMQEINNVNKITSTSSEHYSSILIEFNSGVDLNTAMLDIQSGLQNIKTSLPEGTLDSIILKINPSMIPILSVAVSEKNSSISQSSDYLEGVSSTLRSSAGVASITNNGLIDNLMLVMISEEKTNDFVVEFVQPSEEDFYFPVDKDGDGVNDVDGEGHEITEFDEEAYNNAVEQAETAAAQLSNMLMNMMTSDLLGTAIMAQNQELPVGTIKEGNNNFVLKIGDEIESYEELYNMPVITIDFKKAFEQYDGIINALAGITVYQSTINAMKDAGDPDGIYKKTIIGLIEALDDIETSDAFVVTDGVYTVNPDIIDTLRTLSNSSSSLRNVRINDSRISTLEMFFPGIGEFITTSGIFVLDDKGTEDLLDDEWKVKESLVSTAGLLGDLADKLDELEFTQDDIDNARNTLQGMYDMGDTISQAGTALEEFATTSPYVSAIYKKDDEGNIRYLTDTEGNYVLDDNGEKIPLVDYYQINRGTIEYLKNLEPLTIHLNNISDILTLNNASTVHNIVNGSQGVILNINKQPTYSTVTVSENVIEKLDEIKAENPDLDYIILYNQGAQAQAMIDSLLSNILLGALFAIIVLFLFLWDIKPTLIISISIFASVIATFVFMYFAGISLNIVSMSGLCVAIGMLVDNSIVVLENIYQLRAEGKSIYESCVKGAKQMGLAITASTITTIVVFLPMLFISGITKQIFIDIAYTLSFALVLSLIVALTVVPMSCSLLLKKPAKEPGKIFTKFRDFYVKLLDKCLNRKWIVIVIVTVFFGLSIGSLFFMNRTFFPTAEDKYLKITVEIDEKLIPETTTYDEAVDKIVNSIYGYSKTLDCIEDIGISLSGGLSVGGYSLGDKSLSVNVVLKKDSDMSTKVLGEKFVKATASIPGLPEDSYKMSYVAETDLFGGLLSSSSLYVTLNGNNLENVRADAKALAEKFRGIDGVKEVDDGVGRMTMEYYMLVDKEKASALAGLTLGELMLTINEELSTNDSATSITYEETEEIYDVYVYRSAYSIQRWYLLKNELNKEVRMYEDLDGTFFVMNGKDKAAVIRAEENVYKYTIEEVEHTINANLTGLDPYYVICRTQPLDILLYNISNVALSGTDFEYSINVPLYKILDESCFIKDTDGNIIYRTEKDENGQTVYEKDEFGELIMDENDKPIPIFILDGEGEKIPQSLIMKEGFLSIGHENGIRQNDITVTYESKANVTKIENAIQSILDDYTVKEGVEVVFSGENEIISEVYSNLIFVLALGIAFVFLVMVAQFQSIKLPFIIMFSIPLAFTGSILGLWIAGKPMSVIALVGLIILMGVVVNNGIVFIDYIKQLIDKGYSKRDAILETGKSRLRPILMTTTTTVIALVGMAFDSSADGSIMQPIAITTLGGLTYATILTLFFVPTLFDTFDKGKKSKYLEEDKEFMENKENIPQESSALAPIEVGAPALAISASDSVIILEDANSEIEDQTIKDTHLADTTIIENESGFNTKAEVNIINDNALDNEQNEEKSEKATDKNILTKLKNWVSKFKGRKE